MARSGCGLGPTLQKAPSSAGGSLPMTGRFVWCTTLCVAQALNERCTALPCSCTGPGAPLRDRCAAKHKQAHSTCHVLQCQVCCWGSAPPQAQRRPSAWGCSGACWRPRPGCGWPAAGTAAWLPAVLFGQRPARASSECPSGAWHQGWSVLHSPVDLWLCAAPLVNSGTAALLAQRTPQAGRCRTSLSVLNRCQPVPTQRSLP